MCWGVGATVDCCSLAPWTCSPESHPCEQAGAQAGCDPQKPALVTRGGSRVGGDVCPGTAWRPLSPVVSGSQEPSTSPGEGYPLQYSGLENSMGCIVHGVAKIRT